MLPFFLVSGYRWNSGSLLGLGVDRVLPAEGAILVQLQTVGSVFLVFLGVVVALLALVAPQGDLHPVASFCHTFGTSLLLAGPTKRAGPGGLPVPARKSPQRGPKRGGVDRH